MLVIQKFYIELSKLALKTKQIKSRGELIKEPEGERVLYKFLRGRAKYVFVGRLFTRRRKRVFFYFL